MNKYNCGHMDAPKPPDPKYGKGGSMPPIKDSGFAGVPGKTQPTDRSNGIPKTGKLGPFRIKSEGI